MKNILEVLRQKEAQLTQLKLEISAFKVVIPFLVEESDIKAEVSSAKPEGEKIGFP